MWVNYSGELGLGNRDETSTPTKIPSIPSMGFVAGKRSQTMVVDNDSYLWVSGAIPNGELGAEGGDKFVPSKLAKFEKITSLSVGGTHTFNIKK